jgi:diguanylate cyclase (GGDEF)-like protein
LKFLYPIWGFFLSFSAPLGWLALRIGPSLWARPNDAFLILWQEISNHAFQYGYMHVGAVFTLTFCGFALGWRDDRIREHYNKLLSQRRLLSIKNRQLARLSVTDSLTGLANRLRLHDVLALEYKRALRYNSELCVILVDIDHFKRINDTHGHLYGDFVLHELGQIFATSRRETDYVARTGGEEFCFVLTQTNLNDAIRFAERVRENVAQHRFKYNDIEAPVRLSAGVASVHHIENPDPDDRGQKLLGVADEALYEAKRLGRNQIRVFKPASFAVPASA